MHEIYDAPITSCLPLTLEYAELAQDLLGSFLGQEVSAVLKFMYLDIG